MRARRPTPYCSDPVAAIPTKALARIAAVAESAPTTRCREEPNKANNAVGMSTRVETRDHRRAGDLGVAHYFWDGNCGKRDTGKNFGRNLSGRNRQHPLKDRESVASGMIVC